MTLKKYHIKYVQTLMQIYGEGEATKMTEMIFEYVIKINKQQIIINGNDIIDTEVEDKLNSSLNKLLQHYPIQYLIGEAWFYNIKFIVYEQVLIPRPETEELVHEAILFLKKSSNKKIIDIGTGSGCISISIKKNISDADVTALDISEEALTIAIKNATANNVAINFKLINFLEESNYAFFKKFDLIISNPPYIPELEEKIMNKNVAMHEPHIALFVPQNEPLLFYKKIANFAENHLATNGKIMLEVHEDLANETAALFTKKNYLVVIKKDMQGKERMLIIYRSL